MIRSATLAILFIFTVFTSCVKQPVNEKIFTAIWNEYVQKEFEESFDEKQSISQREKIFKDIASKSSINLEDLKQYMQKKHADKYKKIFLNQ
jgi:hypothetical protein